MKKQTILVLAIVITSVSFALATYALVSGSLWLHKSASSTLLDQIAAVQPGKNIESVLDQLGGQYNVYTNIDDILKCGSIQDEEFLKGKKLHRFYASTPPCRVLDVYTDMNDIVVYTTWCGL